MAAQKCFLTTPSSPFPWLNTSKWLMCWMCPSSSYSRVSIYRPRFSLYPYRSQHLKNTMWKEQLQTWIPYTWKEIPRHESLIGQSGRSFLCKSLGIIDTDCEMQSSKINSSLSQKGWISDHTNFPTFIPTSRNDWSAVRRWKMSRGLNFSF